MTSVNDNDDDISQNVKIATEPLVLGRVYSYGGFR